ncbi:MAG: low molecular weight phosphotyrosine protein phosphatase [Lentisphaeria bacterium]|nr:low molecular weight phosphotyrosine protein phosphatase [Lentisphaeria bacterium]
MKKILFVCHGNICRSPMAESVMKDLVEKRGLDEHFYIESAAVSAEELGNAVYPPAREILRAHGLSCAEKRARQLTPADYSRFDLIVCMDRSNIQRAGRILSGDPEGKLSLLMDWTDRPGNVSDPWYTGDFEAAWRDISEGCRAMLEKLEPEKAL